MNVNGVVSYFFLYFMPLNVRHFYKNEFIFNSLQDPLTTIYGYRNKHINKGSRNKTKQS